MTLRARIAVGMLASTTLLAAVGAITELQAMLGGENLRERLEVIQRFAIIHLIVYLGSGVAWFFWQSNANRRLRDLGVEGMRFTPASSIWWWLIPIANLGVPQQAMDELWKASDPAVAPNAWKGVRSSPFLVFWWVGWIAAALLGQGTLRSGDFESALGWEVARNTVTVLAGLLAILLVRGIDRRILLKSSGEFLPAVPVAPGVPTAATAPVGAVVLPVPRGGPSGKQVALIGVPVAVLIVGGIAAFVLLREPDVPVSTTGPADIARPPTKSVVKEPLTGRVAFSSRVDGDAEIYVVNVDGSGRVIKLTNNDVNDAAPSWSPDGRRIAFTRFFGSTTDLTSTSDLFIINADGTNESALTNTPAQEFWSVWSPNGRTFLFTEGITDKEVELFRMNVDGSDRKRLTNNDVIDDFPAWSPDSRKIAWASGNFGSADIFTMNSDGSGVRQLTDHPLSDVSPSWSPDGKRIAFVRGDFENDGRPMLYLMDTDGGNSMVLTSGESLRGPTWSPRGTWIMYASGADLFVIGADGLDQRLIETESGGEGYPVWRKG